MTFPQLCFTEKTFLGWSRNSWKPINWGHHVDFRSRPLLEMLKRYMWKWKGNSGRYFSVQVANIVVLSVHGKGVNKIFTIWAFPHFMKITARFRWLFSTWRACRAGALERAGCCWASPRGRRAAPRWGPGQPIRGEYCGDCWTNRSSPGGCSHPTRSRTQSSGSASSRHVEQWHWARIKAH